MTMEITFYFDPISPYCWLAAHRMKELKTSELVIDCVPVLFAGLLHQFGQKGPAEIDTKRERARCFRHTHASRQG